MNYISYTGPFSITCILYLWLINAIFFDRFDIVGYGCMTCIGNSGPLPEPVSEAIEKVNTTSTTADHCFMFTFCVIFEATNEMQHSHFITLLLEPLE